MIISDLGGIIQLLREPVPYQLILTLFWGFLVESTMSDGWKGGAICQYVDCFDELEDAISQLLTILWCDFGVTMTLKYLIIRLFCV